jgi:hypothetical protein
MLRRKDKFVTCPTSISNQHLVFKSKNDAFSPSHFSTLNHLANWALQSGIYFFHWHLLRQTIWEWDVDEAEADEVDEEYVGDLLNIGGAYFLLSPNGTFTEFNITKGLLTKSISIEQMKKIFLR